MFTSLIRFFRRLFGIKSPVERPDRTEEALRELPDPAGFPEDGSDVFDEHAIGERVVLPETPARDRSLDPIEIEEGEEGFIESLPA